MKKTALHPSHLKYNAKMVEFAGYEMPIQYSSIKEEHHAVRNGAGVFDVSHMGEIQIVGKEASDLVDYIFSNNVRTLTAEQIQYGFMLYEDGGVVDDFLVYKINDQSYLFVVNAANKDKDYEWILKQNTFDADVIDKTDQFSEVALQGPRSEAILQSLTETDLSSLRTFTFTECTIDGETFLVSRTGYTGEDGFEVYGGHEATRSLFERLIDDYDVTPCGLGARDTLRFEAALPLYGHELSAEITPLEAGLSFAVSFEKEDFIGRKALEKQKEEGLRHRIVGLELLDKGILREGYEIYKDEDRIGRITSGYLSPTLEKPIAMALIDRPHTKKGTEVEIKVRKRMLKARVRNKKFLA